MSYQPVIGDIVTDSYGNGKGTVVAKKLPNKEAYYNEERFWVLFDRNKIPLHCEVESLTLVRVGTNDEIAKALETWRNHSYYENEKKKVI